MATRIGTIENINETDVVLPRTCIKAIADKNGEYLSEDVTASDFNALKNGAISSLSTYQEYVVSSYIRIRKYGSLYQILFYYATSDSNGVIFTIPSGWLPTLPFTINGVVRIGSSMGLVRIEQNGEVYTYSATGSVMTNTADIVGQIFYS